MKERARLFGKKYTLKELYKIINSDADPDIEFVDENLDYICDCSFVDFFEDYRLTFRWRKNNSLADVYVRRHRDGTEAILYVYHKNGK